MTKRVHKAARRVENGRLAYYLKAANAGFWERHWQHHFSPEIYHQAELGRLGEFVEKPFTRWLPPQGRILEAGCGLGHLVLALRARGYDAEGVEMSSAVVELVKHCRSNLPIRSGDVACLNVPDGYYMGYISLGVVEHRKEGPEPFLKEAWRILKPGGVALVSVPWFNPMRLWKGRLGFYRGATDGLGFYQYAFPEEEFCELMSHCGFEVVNSTSYDSIKGLKDEIMLLRCMLGSQIIGGYVKSLLQAFLKRCPKLTQRVGHMLLVVGRKPVE